MRRLGTLAALSCLVVCAAAHAQDAAKPDTSPQHPWPGGDRASLEIPDDIWDKVLAGTTPGRRPLGYSGDEMRFFGGRDHLLRTVDNLFRDVRHVPRDTGRITDAMLKAAGDGKIDELVQTCWALTDLPSGRMVAAPAGDDWGFEGIAKGATCEAAARVLDGWDTVTSTGPDGRRYKGREPRDFSSFLALPEPVQRFAIRIEIAARRADPWFAAGRESAEDALLARQSRDAKAGPEWNRTPVWKSAVRWPGDLLGPWTDEKEDQSATLASAPFTLLRDFDRAPTAYGSVIFLAHASKAIAEFRAWLDGGGREELAKLEDLPDLSLGSVLLRGVGDDTCSAEVGSTVVIDLGGNDRWAGAHASAWGVDPLSVVIDCAGNDVYDAADTSYALGCGVFGLGAVIDLSGNDTYTVKSDGLGRGLFGTGLLWDLGGDDAYVVKTKWGQGAAHAGVGVLLDSAGNDTYECAEQSQGLGSTLGCGLLMDLAGNDKYICRDDGNVSALYLNQSVAMAQGCGYGRRADIGDGRSLAGGWGLLVDGAGDDLYHAQCWSQGCGYWWAVGVLEDRGGNDVYENGKYSLGAGAHFAIGVQVDLSGDDKYNQGVATTKNQFQGHARDGSVGISIDGDGNDHYALKNMCAGCADLCSVAIFWDRRGDDVYAAAMEKDLGDTGPFGTSTIYPPARSFRDDMPAVGVFLDTGGKDTYTGDPRGDAGVRDGGASGAEWRENKNRAAWGVGADLPIW
ncbi:MAG: hypothetical protein K8T90_02945 [Planctomycetes bacterium]|nr:hypothetical protein [Planctomycetota bacterium]